MTMILLPRWLRHFLANILGFFWLSCPRCRQPFAGWETGGGGVYSNPSSSVCRSTCWRCPPVFTTPDGLLLGFRAKGFCYWAAGTPQRADLEQAVGFKESAQKALNVYRAAGADSFKTTPPSGQYHGVTLEPGESMNVSINLKR